MTVLDRLTDAICSDSAPEIRETQLALVADLGKHEPGLLRESRPVDGPSPCGVALSEQCSRCDGRLDEEKFCAECGAVTTQHDGGETASLSGPCAVSPQEEE